MTEEEKLIEKEDNDIRTVCKTPEGRRLYWKLMAECKAFSIKFTGDTNQSYWMQGRKSVGLDMFHDLLRACPERYMQMQQENDSQKTRENMKQERKIKLKKPLNIDSPSLPNTGDRRVKEVVHG